MGYFALNADDEPTAKGLVKSALYNLELYLPYCCSGKYKDNLGQTPPDYLVKDLAIKYLKDALEILEET